MEQPICPYCNYPLNSFTCENCGKTIVLEEWENLEPKKKKKKKVVN